MSRVTTATHGSPAETYCVGQPSAPLLQTEPIRPKHPRRVRAERRVAALRYAMQRYPRRHSARMMMGSPTAAGPIQNTISGN
jgi:hypothetical protein